MKNLKKIAVVLLAVLMVAAVFTACDVKVTQEQKILGSWRDSTGTIGYEFLEGGACKITYADVTIPIINIKYDGTVDGTYSLSKDENDVLHLNVTYTILSKSVTKNYTYTIDGNALNLTDTADGSVTTLLAYTAPGETTTAAQ
ncbi:MAG: hypothetical protein IKB94_03990 [Clostridia bacterium]|nr:hypothetical protein [Clostridia bacterium]MBR2892996.1 hypothetical protein [Clostridia bacterium]